MPTTTRSGAQKAPRSRRSSAPRSAAAAPRAKRRGRQVPRLWTKPLRKLTPSTSLGFEAVQFADWIHERLTQLAAERDEPELLDLVPKLLEWQRWLLIHALELLPGPGKVFRFRTVLLLVARQNGKTVVLIYLILWRLFTDGAKTVVGTAQSLDIAEEAWDIVLAVAESIPELESEIARVNRVNGKKSFVLESRERYKIAAASRRGGRGLTGDLVILDELREHQTWNSYAAVSKTTISRERAQVWGVSNAGDAASIVLAHLRKVAIATIEGTTLDTSTDDDEQDIDAAAIGLFEWSAGDDPRTGNQRSVWDREGWELSNPSMGYSGLSETAIAAAAGTDPEWVFRTEVMCDFVNTVGAGPFPMGSWQKTMIPTVTRDKERPACYGIDLSHDRTMAYIALAYWDTEGRRRVEIAARRAGTEWIIPWLLDPKRAVKPDHLAFQTRGAPISSLVDDFEKAGFDVTEWAGPDLSRWTGVFYDGIRRSMDDEDNEITLTHGAQPILDLAANSAEIKPLGDGWVINRNKSLEDASPLVAAIAAIGLLNTEAMNRGTSVYEERGLLSF
jgi:hypothetical protein